MLKKSKFSPTLLLFAMILVGYCAKKASQQCDCQAPADKTVQAVFSPNIGGVNVPTQLFYSTAKGQCDIALNDHLDRGRFTRILSSLQGILDFTESAGVTSKAFSIFLNKEMRKDSSVSLDDVLAVSRYFTTSGKLYHQFFVKAPGTASFTEVKDLSAEVDGVIFNFMHSIAQKVLVANPAATAYFLKTEDSKDLYKNLRNPHDDLGWRLKV